MEPEDVYENPVVIFYTQYAKSIDDDIWDLLSEKKRDEILDRAFERAAAMSGLSEKDLETILNKLTLPSV